MVINNKYSRTVRIRVDPELFKRIQKEAKKLEVDIPTYIKWCIKTGIYLDDLNAFVRTQSDES